MMLQERAPAAPLPASGDAACWPVMAPSQPFAPWRVARGPLLIGCALMLGISAAALAWLVAPVLCPGLVLDAYPWVVPVARSAVVLHAPDRFLERVDAWGDSAVPGLVLCLHHRLPEVRRLAAQTFARAACVRNAAAAPPLIAALDDDDDQTIRYAVQALRQMRLDPPQAARLARALDDLDPTPEAADDDPPAGQPPGSRTPGARH
jgi:hypothetical protein